MTGSIRWVFRLAKNRTGHSEFCHPVIGANCCRLSVKCPIGPGQWCSDDSWHCPANGGQGRPSRHGSDERERAVAGHELVWWGRGEVEVGFGLVRIQSGLSSGTADRRQANPHGRARTPFAYLVVPRGCRAVLTGPEPIKLCPASRGAPQPGGPVGPVPIPRRLRPPESHHAALGRDPHLKLSQPENLMQVTR